jgi:hypothetical protein
LIQWGPSSGPAFAKSGACSIVRKTIGIPCRRAASRTRALEELAEIDGKRSRR